MNPSSSVDTAAMLDVSELINRLTENDEEHERLKAEERERQEKAARRTAQDKAKSAAESLTTRMIKHTANIAAALSSGKKSVPVKLKSASGAALQAYSPSPSLCLPLSLPLSLSFPPSLFLSLSLTHTCHSPQAFTMCESELATVQTNLTATGYDPASVAQAQASSRPGKRKLPETWNVSRSGNFHPIPPPVCSIYVGLPALHRRS